MDALVRPQKKDGRGRPSYKSRCNCWTGSYRPGGDDEPPPPLPPPPPGCMRSRMRCSQKRRMSSGLPPPKGVNGMIGIWLLVDVGGVELELAPLPDALLDRDLPPDELTLTLEYIAPSVC